MDLKSPNAWPPQGSIFWGKKPVTLTYDAPVATTGDTECFERRFLTIFFDPTVSIGTEVAWFYYWKDTVDLDLIKKLDYGGAPGSYQGYSALTWYAETIVWDNAVEESPGDSPDIHKFVRVIEHEKCHLWIEAMFWGEYGVDYDESEDTDGDGYPDYWEENSPVAAEYGFSVGLGIDDSFDHNELQNAGTIFEEEYCDAWADSIDISPFDVLDWSKGGKQWEEE